MASSKIANLSLPQESRILEKLGVSLKPTSLTFRRKLTQAQMRAVVVIVDESESSRTCGKRRLNQLGLGDWLLTAERWFVKKFVADSTTEEHRLRAFKIKC